MKVLLINGSPHERGNTYQALNEAAQALVEQGLETEIVWIGTKPVRGCIACGTCATKGDGHCVFNDDLCNEVIDKMNAASQYWNIAYGLEPGDIAQDAEGLQTMRTMARNMAWMIKQFKSGSAQSPEYEPWQGTHFIR